MANNKKKMLLVDGTALAYQSFFALKNLSSPSGRPTGAVFGFHQTIQALREEYAPDYLLVALDRGAPLDRSEAFADYKAHRPPTPTELLEQFPVIEELMTVLGVSVFSQEGVEADDILGTLARRAPAEEVEVYVFSPDKDMLQVVDEKTKIIRRHGANTKIYDRSAVIERYGCPPERLPDLLGLMGDSVDNIPGVPGIGEKTASALLAEHGNLEAVLDAAPGIAKPKLRESLLANRDQALLSRDLAVLRCDLPLEISLEDLFPAEPDWAHAAEMFRDLGFKRAREDAEGKLGKAYGPGVQPSPSNGQSLEVDYRIIDTREGLERLAQVLRDEQPFALDTETTSITAHSARLAGICLGLGAGKGWYIPVSHQGAINLDLDIIREILGPLLADPAIGKIGHNLKYDAWILERHGLPVRGWMGDSLVLAHLLHSQKESFKLDNLAVEFLDRKMIPITDLLGEKKASQITMDFVEVEKACAYGAEDAEITLALHRALEAELDRQGVRAWYEEVEIPLSLALFEMEKRGIRIDPSILKRQSAEVGELIERIQAEVFALAGREFNPNSPAQLAKILFDERGVPGGKKRSTRQEVLEDLARAGEPLAAKIIEFRQASKLKGTYLDALPELLHEDGRVHTSYSTTVANTGRISSSNPNLQNIPIRTELGRRIREAFIAEKGHFFVAADYSQIELRVLAHFSQDPGFLRAFKEGQDIHAFTASEVFEVDPSQVDKDMRRKAKEINFGLNYGMSSFGLASRLGISRGEAKVFMDRYFRRYPRIRDYFDQILEAAERDGFVKTLVGRRIEIQRPRSGTGAEARAAINAPIQGSAADILKKAMVDLERELRERGMKSAMVLTVHDEIILEAPESEVEAVCEILPRIMKEAVSMSVPIEVDVCVGESWAALG